MHVILTNDVVGVGDIGEKVKVKPGYARNYLIPRGFAMEAETSSARVIDHKMRQIEARKKRLKGVAEEEAEKIRNATVTIGLRVGSTGKVFGSINTKDIAEGLKKEGFEIDRRRVLLPEPIRKTGTHFVSVKLHSEVQAQLKLEIEEVRATKEEEEKATQDAKAAIEQAAVEKAGEFEDGEDAAGEAIEPEAEASEEEPSE